TLANLSDRLSGAPGARGRSVAPAWIDAAEQAHAAAEERRGDDLASAEYEMTARLLFEAAVLRADQIALDRQRQSLAKEAEGAWGAAHRDGALLDERIRRDWDRSAASLARQEATRVLAVAEEAPSHRRSRVTESDQRVAAKRLLDRVRVAAAAARALGEEGEAIVALERDLAAFHDMADASQALSGAERLWVRAAAVLVDHERRRGGNPPRALTAVAADLGVSLEHRPLGIFAPLAGRGARSLRQLAALALAVPSVPIVILGSKVSRDALREALVASAVSMERVVRAPEGALSGEAGLLFVRLSVVSSEEGLGGPAGEVDGAEDRNAPKPEDSKE
ncbi:MAG: hypothetical protein KC416_04565, partial [Myxococcales bacterium]|nr:hypothetical protein [Myxococcales bacterium]